LNLYTKEFEGGVKLFYGVSQRRDQLTRSPATVSGSRGENSQRNASPFPAPLRDANRIKTKFEEGDVGRGQTSKRESQGLIRTQKRGGEGECVGERE